MPASAMSRAGQASRFGVTSLGNALVLGLMNFPLLRALALPLSATKEHAPEGKNPKDPTLWIYLAFAMTLVIFGGIFAGLTIALMGQDEIYLEVLHSSGDENEQKHAGKVLRLLKRGKHWVLVTLLLSNVITNETLPIVLDRSLGGGWPAVVSSTALIVIFGEVIPQSICVRYGLPIGAYLSSTVLVLMYIMSPIAWPTAKLLDYLLGEDHGTVYKKAGLKTLVTLHMSLGKSPGERLNEDEVTIITAVLDLKAKSVSTIMTPIDDVFTMSSDTVLDEKTVDGILAAGYSRIPIHTPDNPVNFIGMLLVRMLITYDPEDASKVSDMALATLPETKPDTSCLDVINFFQEGKSHMLVVSETPGEKNGALGVVTLEDVIEELIGEEIIDESDVYIDNERTARRKFSNASIIVKPSDMQPHDPKKSQSELSSSPTPHDESSPVFAPPRRRSTNLSLRQTLIASSNKNARARSRSPAPGAAGDHPKHLGPSNLASKPLASKNTKIKIKPGKGLDSDVLAATEGLREAAVNESTPLIGGSQK